MDKKVCYVYSLWFNPNDSKEWGDISFNFKKEALIFYDDGTGKYISDHFCSDYFIYDDGSNSFIVTINEKEEYIIIEKVSFDPDYMGTFKNDSMRYLLNDLWNKYVRKKENNDD